MRGALARSVIQWLVASAAFLGLAVALTWPWVAHIRGRETFGDAAQFVWDSWWLLESVSGFENPWFTDRLFAPEGTWLTAHPLEALLMVVLSPLTAVVGPMTAFGILVIVTLALAGVLAWRLGLCLGLGHVGAAVAGLLWAASPIVVYKSTGHYMLLVLAMLLPAALVLAARLARSHSTRDGAFLGLLLGASMLTDLQVTAYLLLALVASATYVLATRPAWRSRVAIRPLVALAVTFVLVGLPLTISVLRAERDGDYSTPLPLRMFSATHYNADATQFVLPSPASRFFSDDYHTAAARLGNLATFPIDTPVTLGWAALTLAVVGVAATWRRRRTWWMVCAVLACMLLSLGPNLKVAGRMYTPLAVDYGGERVSAIAPASWLLWMPVVKDLRIPARFMQLASATAGTHGWNRCECPRASMADCWNSGRRRSLRPRHRGRSGRRAWRAAKRGTRDRADHPRRPKRWDRRRRSTELAERNRAGRGTSRSRPSNAPANHPWKADRVGLHCSNGQRASSPSHRTPALPLASHFARGRIGCTTHGGPHNGRGRHGCPATAGALDCGVAGSGPASAAPSSLRGLPPRR